MTKVRFYPFEDDYRLEFAVICATVDGQAVWCRHRDRETWELPGGHIESGETARKAAKRELREETGATQFSLNPICAYSVERDGAETFGALFSAEISAFGSLKHEIAEIAVSADPPGEWTYPEIQPLLLKRVCGKAKSAAKRKPRMMKILAVAMAFALMFAGFMLHSAYKDKQSWLWTNPVVRCLRVWNWHGKRDYQAALARIRRVDRNAADNASHSSYGDGAGYWFICQEHSSDDPPQAAHNSVWYVSREGAQQLYHGDDMHFIHQYFRDARILYFRTGIEENNFFQTDYSARKLFAYIVGADGPVQLELPDSYLALRKLPTEDSPYAEAESGFHRVYLTVRDGRLQELPGEEMTLDQFVDSSFGARQLLDRIASAEPDSEITELLWHGNGMITINIRCSDGSAGHLHAWIENNTIQYDTDWYGSLVIHPD